jgi:hypothetical protein
LEKLLLVTSSPGAFGGSMGGDTSQSRLEVSRVSAISIGYSSHYQHPYSSLLLLSYSRNESWQPWQTKRDDRNQNFDSDD